MTLRENACCLAGLRRSLIVRASYEHGDDSGSGPSLLSREFTAFTYDRRGRGDSGDTAPYAVEREVEDLEALIDEAGGPAFVFGRSSGAALALEAARRLPTKVEKLAMYEPPFILDESGRPPADEVERLDELIAAGRRGDAVEYFMTRVVRLPAEVVIQARRFAQSKRAPTESNRDALNDGTRRNVPKFFEEPRPRVIVTR